MAKALPHNFIATEQLYVHTQAQIPTAPKRQTTHLTELGRNTKEMPPVTNRHTRHPLEFSLR